MKKLLILVCIISLSANISYANALSGYDAGSVNSQYMRELRMHEFATREKNKSAIVKTTNTADKQLTQIPASSTIKTVSFVNNKSIPASTLTKLVSSKLNQPATEQAISDIRKQITNYYQKNGYYSVLVFPDIKNISSGELIFEIQEGGKNSIVIE